MTSRSSRIYLLADSGVLVPLDLMGLRRLTPCAVECRYDDEAIQMISVDEAGQIVKDLIDWANVEIARSTG